MARFCPNCGSPLVPDHFFCDVCGTQRPYEPQRSIVQMVRPKPFSLLLVVLIGLGALVVLGALDPVERTPTLPRRNAPPSLLQVSAKALRGAIGDAAMLQVALAELMPDGSVCYVYHTESAAGAGNEGYAVLTPERKFAFAAEQGLYALWAAHCADRSGVDWTWQVNYALQHSPPR